MVASVVVTGLVIRFVLVPQLAADRSAFSALERVTAPLLILATGLEIGSLLAYSALTAVILGSPRPGYWTLLRIDLADLGINHVVPGGGTTSGPVRIRLLQRVGVRLADAMIVATVEILGSNVVLGLAFAAGIVSTLATFSSNGYYLAAGTAVLVVLAISAVGGWLVTVRTATAVRAARAVGSRIPGVGAARAQALVRNLTLRLRGLGSRPRRMAAAVVLAGANWLLDAASLAVVCAAFGHAPSLGVLLTVYGLGSILMLVPFTPGGIGLVEGVMVPAFVAFGLPAAPALLGVLGWRVLQYWMPMPLAVAAYTSLRLGTLRSRPRAEQPADATGRPPMSRAPVTRRRRRGSRRRTPRR